MINVIFTCNICGTTHEQNHVDGRVTVPVGWGAVRPTLRVNMPNWSSKFTKKQDKEWDDFRELCDKLKKELYTKEYHLCHKCLKLSNDKILMIETQKKKKG